MANNDRAGCSLCYGPVTATAALLHLKFYKRERERVHAYIWGLKPRFDTFDPTYIIYTSLTFVDNLLKIIPIIGIGPHTQFSYDMIITFCGK